MTNKEIASYAIISFVVFVVGMIIGGENDGGFGGFAYYAGMIGFYVFTIWGYKRLLK